MRLLERYATACDLEIGQQFLLDSFFPLTVERYITLHPSSGMEAKNYPYFQELLALMLPAFNEHKIAVVQVGGKDDPPISGCIHLQGKTTIHQVNYLIARALLHVGNDSWMAHRAAALGVPLITLFGSTTVANHSALTHEPAKTVFLESHRVGKHPTFMTKEQPQTISFIPPEDVANSVIQLIGKTHLPGVNPFTLQTRMVGLLYNQVVFEVVPNSFPTPDFVPGAALSIRMDYEFNEEKLAGCLSTGRMINVVTDKPINLDIIARHRKQILSYIHEIKEDCPTSYVSGVSSLIKNHQFYTKLVDDKAVSDLRATFFDYCIIVKVNDLTKKDYLEAATTYLNAGKDDKRKLDIADEVDYSGSLFKGMQTLNTIPPRGGTLRFKSNKYILSNSKVYLSLAHLKAGKSVDSLADNIADVIDTPEYWKDINHHLIFWQPHSS